jgi:disulfide bond formation protein DsbB
MAKSDVMARWLSLAVPAFLLGGAYVSQYGFGLYPCEMCWWQRYPHFVALALALASFVIAPRRLWIALAGVAVLVSGFIGVYHAGVEYDLWEGLTHCATPIVAGADPLEVVMNQPITRCDEPAWTLLGVSLAGFNALFSIGGALAVLVLLRRKALMSGKTV